MKNESLFALDSFWELRQTQRDEEEWEGQSGAACSSGLPLLPLNTWPPSAAPVSWAGLNNFFTAGNLLGSLNMNSQPGFFTGPITQPVTLELPNVWGILPSRTLFFHVSVIWLQRSRHDCLLGKKD